MRKKAIVLVMPVEIIFDYCENRMGEMQNSLMLN
jgi:hypothetical protein